MNINRNSLKVQRFTPYLLIAISIVACVLFSDSYLDHTASQFESDLRLQNFVELSRFDTYALTQRLNALSRSSAWSCMDGRRNGTVFFHAGRKNCAAGLFERAISLRSGDDANGLEVDLVLGLSRQSKWALFALLLAQILILLSVRKTTQIADRDRRVAEERLYHLAAQVAHDIRSPLSALNMITGALEEVAPDRRQLLKNAIQRINDIANDLLRQSRSSPHLDTGVQFLKSGAVSEGDSEQAEAPVMIIGLLDQLISEKRLQCRERLQVEIVTDLEQGYGLFANVPAKELARAFSNLIDNALDAIGIKGRVMVAIRSYRHEVGVVISDDGRGMSGEILKRFGERGFSSRKESRSSGNGLGVYHAKKTVEAAGGRILVQSREGEGSVVTLVLPRAEAPEWFAEAVSLGSASMVVTVDDEPTVHQLWGRRLEQLANVGRKIAHRSFSTLEAFEAFLAGVGPEDSFVTLMDQEFSGHRETGLEFLKRKNLPGPAILVTSRFDETTIQTRAKEKGLRILPKPLMSFVSIS